MTSRSKVGIADDVEGIQKDFIQSSMRKLSPFAVLAGLYGKDDRRPRLWDIAARVYCALFFSVRVILLLVLVVDLCRITNCTGVFLSKVNDVVHTCYNIILPLIWYRMSLRTSHLSSLLEKAYISVSQDKALSLKLHRLILISEGAIVFIILICLGLEASFIAFFLPRGMGEYGLPQVTTLPFPFGDIQTVLKVLISVHFFYPQIVILSHLCLSCYLLHYVFKKCNEDISTTFLNEKNIPADKIEQLRQNYEQCVSSLLETDTIYSLYIGVSITYFMFHLCIIIYISNSESSSVLVIPVIIILAVIVIAPALATNKVSIVIVL